MAGMMTRTLLSRALLGLLAPVALAGTPALAQQRPAEGSRSTITYSLGANAGRNLDLDAGSDETSARMEGLLGYLYRLQNRQTTLSFNAQLRPESSDEDGARMYPTLGLRVQHEAARTRLSLDASYNRAKVTDQSIGYDDTGTVIFYDSTGQRSLARVSASITGGIDMPLGYSFGVSQSRIDYYDLPVASSYAASKNDTVSGGLRADVTAMTSLLLNLSHQRYSSENTDQTRRTTDQADLTVQQRIDAVTGIDLMIGRERISTSRVTRPDEDQSGMVYGLSLRRDDQIGAYRFDYDRSLTEEGTRDSLSVGRNRKNLFGEFSGTIGLSKGENGDPEVIGSLSYSTELPRDRMSVSLTRAVRSDDDGLDVVVTRLSGTLSHTLSSVNSLNFGVTASSAEYSDRDQTRADASFGYQHALTQDVSLQAGVRLGLLEETGEERADSQSVFLTLTRQFDILH